ncbi:unnamed protein product [Moneuplotes crassus]|uniref:Uncharacterized protein n=1 Tax=Euplotes crassus TaxID=5936 RepID=A0AAD2DBI9_EUPCR|nr:unnamed protein product [Moneuplotes crassus]
MEDKNTTEDQKKDYDKIMMMLVRIGDEKVELLDSHIQKLTAYLCSKIEVHGSAIAYHLLTCISNIPQKAFIYAYILKNMAVEENEHTVNIVNQVFTMLNEKISLNEDVSLIIKFFGALADTGYLSVLAMDKLLKQMLEFSAKSAEQSQSNDYFLNLALIGYMFSVRVFRENAGAGNTPEIESLLETHVQKRKADLEQAGQTDKSDTMIELYWKAIKLSLDSNQVAQSLEENIYSVYLRPSPEFCQELDTKEISAIDSLSDLTIEGELPQLKLQGYFGLFSQRFINQVDIVFYAVARDLVKSVLIAFADNSYFACQRLIELKTIPLLSYLICDCIMEEILRVPEPIKRVIVFSSICVTMSKEFTVEGGSFNFGPAIGETIQLIFGAQSPEEGENIENLKKITDMNLELVDRVLEWLSFFLFQQEFNWDWNSWVFVCEQDDQNIQKVFVRNLLAKCLNLTQPQALYDSLPEGLKGLIDLDKSGTFTHINENKDNYDAQRILEDMSTRERTFDKTSFEVEVSGNDLIDIFTECFLYKTQKSLRHNKKLADKFTLFIKAEFTEESAQVVALQAIFRVWQKDEYKTVNIVNEFVNLDILKSQTVIKFCFEKIRTNPYTNNMYWKEWAILQKILKKQLAKYDCLAQKSQNKEENKQEQLEDDQKEQIKTDTKELLQCLFNSIEICVKEIQEVSTEDADETVNVPLPLETRVAILNNRKECFESIFSRYIKELS